MIEALAARIGSLRFCECGMEGVVRAGVVRVLHSIIRTTTQTRTNPAQPSRIYPCLMGEIDRIPRLSCYWDSTYRRMISLRLAFLGRYRRACHSSSPRS